MQQDEIFLSNHFELYPNMKYLINFYNIFHTEFGIIPNQLYITNTK